MVKNIVFDMGNVLVRYDSMKVCRHFMTDEAEMEKVCTSVFISPEWLMLDMGLITEAEALKRMQRRSLIPFRGFRRIGPFWMLSEVQCSQ